MFLGSVYNAWMPQILICQPFSTFLIIVTIPNVCGTVQISSHSKVQTLEDLAT